MTPPFAAGDHRRRSGARCEPQSPISRLRTHRRVSATASRGRWERERGRGRPGHPRRPRAGTFVCGVSPQARRAPAPALPGRDGSPW